MITYAVGERVITRRHGEGVVERYFHAERSRIYSTYLVRIPGRRRAVLCYAGEIARVAPPPGTPS